MEPAVFEFRVCCNPECGLRYPAPRVNKRGQRCPVCLGNTKVAAERRSERESNEATDQGSRPTHLRAVIDNVRSGLNVGSIFRSAEGYGIGHLYLCGITPTPESPEVRKTALGAERLVPWTAHKNAVRLIASLKQERHCVWALERTARSRTLDTVLVDNQYDTDSILVVGNEQAGIDPGILELADEVVRLEMRGRKSSFNVAVAFAIAVHVLSKSKT